MVRHKAEVLKKLGSRRKMFEDYITLVKKPDGLKVRSGLRAAVKGSKSPG